jgi:hypothetical protein
MADGWRNRYMAPLYALAISFVLVLLLGFTLDTPGPVKPLTPATVTKTVAPKPVKSALRFSSKEAPFPVTTATIWWGTHDETVRSLAEFTKLEVTPPVRVCALMANGWVALKAKKLGKDYVCWGPLEPEEPGGAITIDVGKGE